MAITKITPPPPMTVGEYRNAALRHLHTCDVLWRYVRLPDTSNLKKLPEDEILKNIFYLTGYIAECAIKYRYLTNNCSLNDYDVESKWASAPGKMKKHFSFIPSPISSRINDKMWSEGIVADISRSGTVLPIYLQILGAVITTHSTTPTVEQCMQGSWEPTIRYHYATNGLPLPPDKTDIEAFYQATKSLLRDLSII